jgi:hypothetical protein
MLFALTAPFVFQVMQIKKIGNLTRADWLWEPSAVLCWVISRWLLSHLAALRSKPWS